MTGLFLPAVVRPMLDSFESSKQVPQPALKDVSTMILHPISNKNLNFSLDACTFSSSVQLT